jgi:hypothetical protein
MPNPSLPQDDLEELHRQEDLMKSQLQQLNQANPLGQQISNLPANTDLEQMSKVLNSPIVQAYIRTFSNPELLTQVKQIAKSTHRQTTLLAEGAFLVIFVIFKVLLAARIRNWLAIIFFRIVTNLIYTAVASFIIPVIIIGDPYRKILSILWTGIKSLWQN